PRPWITTAREEPHPRRTPCRRSDRSNTECRRSSKRRGGGCFATQAFWLFVESGGSGSCGVTSGHGGRDAEGEEAANAIVVADGVGGHEPQLAKEVVVIAVAASATDKGLPVVIERFESSDGRPVLGESDDLVPAFVERVVQTPQGGNVAPGGPTQDALQPDL